MVVEDVADSRVNHGVSTGVGDAEDPEVTFGAEDVAVESFGALGVLSVVLLAAASHHECY